MNEQVLAIVGTRSESVVWVTKDQKTGAITWEWRGDPAGFARVSCELEADDGWIADRDSAPWEWVRLGAVPGRYTIYVQGVKS